MPFTSDMEGLHLLWDATWFPPRLLSAELLLILFSFYHSYLLFIYLLILLMEVILVTYLIGICLVKGHVGCQEHPDTVTALLTKYKPMLFLDSPTLKKTKNGRIDKNYGGSTITMITIY